MTETVAGTPTLTVQAEAPPAPFESAYYIYDGDDNMVMSVINDVTTYYPSSSYVVEVDGSDTTVRKTYSAGSTSLAVRTIVNSTENTLNWMLSDHLGSSSITTAADGTWNSEIRYSAFGETRYSSGITPTDYRYTNQLEQKDVNLYYYNARYYDAALGRFVQPDTIVPENQGVQGWDRYAYANNNPVMYIDPSGHCIFGIIAAVFGGVILGTTVYNNFIHEPSKPVDGNASNLTELMYLGYEHAEHANIVGEGLQSLQDDPSVKDAHDRIVDSITNESIYGQEAFVIESIEEIFTANGPSRKWWKAALEGNQAFYTVHTGTLSAINTRVTSDGIISTTWEITDSFDYLPDKDRGISAYNLFAPPSYLFYNVILGAKEQYPTTATWQETIYPPKSSKKSSSENRTYYLGQGR